MVGLKRIFVVFLSLQFLLYGMSNEVIFGNQAHLSKFNGNVAENFMGEYFKSAGWKQLPGEIGDNGIDGLFVKMKNGVVHDVLCVESKFKSKGIPNISNGSMSIAQSGIDTTMDGSMQMSKKWCRKKIKNLIKFGDPKFKSMYEQIERHIEKGTVRKRYFGFSQRSDGKIVTELHEIMDDGDNKIKITEKSGKPSKLQKLVFDPKNPKNAFEKKLSKIYNDAMNKNEKLFLEKGRATSIQKVSSFLESSEIYKSGTKYSLKEYDEMAKKINRRAFASPALLSNEGKLITSLAGGFSSGIAVVGIEGGMAYYDYLKGDIYKNEFDKKILDSAIKGTAVGGSEALVLFLMETPHGLVLLGAGIGAYIIVDHAIETYKYYKEKHFLNADDLRVYGIELDSVLDIQDDGIPMNVDRW